MSVAGLGVLAYLALYVWLPRSEALKGGSVVQELSSLRKSNVWIVMIIAALGVASIFAVYSFIGPFVTEVVMLDKAWIPIGLGLFGIGMTTGNFIGGRLADLYPSRGLVLGFGFALLVLAILAIFGSNVWILMIGFFGVGTSIMTAIPTIQVRLNKVAPDAPTLMGAMNLAALNVANGLGAWAGGVTIAAGLGLFSAVWAGFSLTFLGLLVFFAYSKRLTK